MKKLILILFFVFLITGTSVAQYNFAIGLRSGGTSGITLKKNNSDRSLEGIIGFWKDGLSLTALWERNAIAFNVSGLKWYYGMGGHFGVYGDNFNTRWGPSWYGNPYNLDNGGVGIGVDGIVGLEYKISEIPIAFSFDFKPYVEILTNDGIFFSFDPGLGIKLAF